MKKLDIEFYRVAKKDFVNNIKRRNVQNWKEFNSEISLYCACTGLPVIVAIEFCLEDFPEYVEELNKKRNVIVEFYGYE